MNTTLYNELLELVEQGIKSAIPVSPSELYNAFTYTMSGGGKRIRAMLAMLTTGAVGGNPKQAINAAIAIEMLHNFTLIHDDIMDNSTVRRGKPTVVAKWNEPTAILAGDSMIGWAFRILIMGSKKPDELVNCLSTALIEVCEGQELDMRYNSMEITLPEYIGMIRLKTSSLLRSAVKLGCIVGECDANIMKQMDSFADNFGIGFQIQDDILDCTSANEKFGKKIGQDLLEGKRSYPILKAIEIANEPNDVTMLTQYLSHKNVLSEDAISEYISLFKRLNIFKLADKEIDQYFQIAEQSLNGIRDNDYVNVLKNMLQMLREREY